MKYPVGTKIRKVKHIWTNRKMPIGITGTIVIDPDSSHFVAVEWDGPDGPFGFTAHGPYGSVSGPYLYEEEELDEFVEIIGA
jgi:hypothetical protein